MYIFFKYKLLLTFYTINYMYFNLCDIIIFEFRRKTMKKYFELIRIKHWIKNFLVFIPMITAKVINYTNVVTVILGWLSFSFISSFIYIINDIIDVFILAFGFIIRIYYGASLLDINVSEWLFLTIFNAALFLGLGKRRKELEINKESRKVLNKYTEEFLTRFEYLCLGLTLVFYSLWTINSDIPYILFSIPIIMFIFMRYCLITEKSNEGDPTTILYQDKPLMFLSFLYSVGMLILLNC